jgi:hypothetical protein
MSDGGKGSNPRPFSVSSQEYANRFDAIFRKDKRVEEDQKNEDEAFDAIINKNEYYDVLKTEDCLVDSDMDKTTRYNDETQAVKK